MKTKETRFTPGPWSINGEDKTINKHGVIIHQIDAGYIESIASVYGTETGLANAKLISAAPDLLECLQYLVSQIKCSNEFFDLGESEQAIQKALTL